MKQDGSKPNKLRLNGTLGWGLAALAAVICGVGVVYYWRVFYGFDAVAPVPMTLAVCAGALAIVLAAWLVVRFVKNFDARAALAVFLCGLCFCFANPPMQAPDESAHFLRAYAVSLGRLDFDGERTFSSDVDALLAAFPGAWANGNTTYWLEYDAAGNVDGGGSSENYAIKQQDGQIVSLADHFALYKQLKTKGSAPVVKESQIKQVLPYLHQALAMALARVVGFGALGCFYAGRVANLAVYVLLCWLALRNCRRYKPVFLAVMLLPLSLYIGASCNYDALMLGCYYLTASYFCVDEIRNKDLVVFLAAFVLMNAVQPWINLLWVVIPLILPARVWKARWKKGQVAAAVLVCAVAVTIGVEWYGQAFRTNYEEVRMLGESVNMAGQLRFVLHNLPRTAMVFLGTLYENNLFLGLLGSFGAMDLNIGIVSMLSPVVLAFASALSVHEKSSLTLRPSLGLFGLAVLYTGGVLAAQYITYTPVAMVRVLGVQARYLLPAFLMLFVLLAALLSHVFETTSAGGKKSFHLGLSVCSFFAVLSAVLLAQHYFIGPVCIVP